MLNSITILLAINITLISHYSERGILTPVGTFRLLLIVIQLGLLIALSRYPQVEWSAFINQEIISDLQISWAFFTQTSLLAVFISILLFSAYFLIWNNSFRNSIFVAMFLF